MSEQESNGKPMLLFGKGVNISNALVLVPLCICVCKTLFFSLRFVGLIKKNQEWKKMNETKTEGESE